MKLALSVSVVSTVMASMTFLAYCAAPKGTKQERVAHRRATGCVTLWLCSVVACVLLMIWGQP